jgi:NitT/TauT family transport system permease protein
MQARAEREGDSAKPQVARSHKDMKTETLAPPHIKTDISGRPYQSFYQRYEGTILGGTAVLIVIGIWQAIWSYTDWISPLFFSGPSAIAKQFWISLTEGNLLADLAFSGKNFAIGFGIALVSGVVMGVLIGWYRRVRLLSNPFLNALYAAPRIAMMPLIIIWFGIGMWSKVFIVFLSAFFPILVTVAESIIWIKFPGLRRYCASDWQVRRAGDFGIGPLHFDGRASGVAVGLIGCRGRDARVERGIGFIRVWVVTFQTTRFRRRHHRIRGHRATSITGGSNVVSRRWPER